MEKRYRIISVSAIGGTMTIDHMGDFFFYRSAYKKAKWLWDCHPDWPMVFFVVKISNRPLALKDPYRIIGL